MLARKNLNARKVLISKGLIDWYISPDKFVSMNNALKWKKQSKMLIIDKKCESQKKNVFDGNNIKFFCIKL